MESTSDLPAYVPLSQAQEIISEAVEEANSPSPPKLLKWCESGQQELRVLNYSANCTLVGLSMLLAASQLLHPESVQSWPTLASTVSALAKQGCHLYEYIVDVHPIATKAVISGVIYGLGDLTAQTYEGRSWKEFDASRIIRSGLCGFLAHGPLSHFFYEKLDRAFILSPYFDGGDAWYTPLAKIAVDQTAFAATWNTLYYFMLGALKLESPGVILNTIKSSWWELLKAGWRVWPIIHIATYTIVPCQDRLLWVDMCELAWVTVLSYYGQQKREKEGAAACALPGGGIFTEDILRGMSVESQVTFQAADGVPVTKRLDEVLVEAALMEANFGQYVEGMDLAGRHAVPVKASRDPED
jgi:protein Mpv17